MPVMAPSDAFGQGGIQNRRNVNRSGGSALTDGIFRGPTTTRRSKEPSGIFDPTWVERARDRFDIDPQPSTRLPRRPSTSSSSTPSFDWQWPSSQPQTRPLFDSRPQPTYRPQTRPQRNYVPSNSVRQPAQRTVPNVQPPANNVQPVVRAEPNVDVDGMVEEGLEVTGSAETDARQAVEAAKAGGNLDEGITRDINSDVLAGKLPQQAEIEWGSIVSNGSDPEDIAKFLEKWEGRIDEGTVLALETRLEFSKYEQDLLDGTLTSAGKAKRLAELEEQVAALKDSKGLPALGDASVVTLEEHVDAMHDLNDMGELADLAAEGEVEDPLGTLIIGVQNAGMPVSMVGDMIGMPVMQTQPVLDTSSGGAPTSGVLINPKENGQAISYALAGNTYTMQPGQQQPLSTSYVVAFDPGNGGGTKRYTVGDGTFEFYINNDGWELRRVNVEVTIDNSDYSGEFHCLIDGKKTTIAPGEVAEFTSKTPLEVEFDRGDGGEPARKSLKSGIYQIGLDASQQRLDLFEAEEEELALVSTDSPPLPLAIGDSGSSPRKKPSKKRRVAEILERLKAQD